MQLPGCAQKRGEPLVQFVEFEQPEHTIALPSDQEKLLSSQRWAA